MKFDVDRRLSYLEGCECHTLLWKVLDSCSSMTMSLRGL
jgi:hypothetical protein